MRSQDAEGDLQGMPYPGQVILLAAVYFTAAKLSLALAIPPGYATPVWPPSGLALAALLILGNRAWPGIWAGATLANLTVASSPLAAVVIGSGNTLEALACAALIRRYGGDVRQIEEAWQVVRFVAFAALSSTVAATLAIAWLALEGAVAPHAIPANWWTWWQGDASGIIIVAPLILSWCAPVQVALPPAMKAESAILAGSLLLVSFLVFGSGDGHLYAAPPLSFAVLPFVVWAAFRFNQRAVCTASAAVCGIAVWNTVRGGGPFAQQSLNHTLLLLLAFISTVVTTGLMVSAAVAERRQAMAKLAGALGALREQASTDPLTGLSNRRHLWEFLQREWLRSRRKSGTLALIMIDLDHFKRMNDSHGHDAGDAVLRQVADLLRAHVRASDIACRFGGEEFVLVLPDVPLQAVELRAEEVREAISRMEPRHRGQPLAGLTASFGVAVFPDHAGEPESLLRAADRALYLAKESGRNRVVSSVAAESSRAMAAV